MPDGLDKGGFSAVNAEQVRTTGSGSREPREDVGAFLLFRPGGEIFYMNQAAREALESLGVGTPTQVRDLPPQLQAALDSTVPRQQEEPPRLRELADGLWGVELPMKELDPEWLRGMVEAEQMAAVGQLAATVAQSSVFSFGTFLTALTKGTALGCIYAIIGLGFVLIFKGTQTLNFAQGALAAVGALFLSFLVADQTIPLTWLPNPLSDLGGTWATWLVNLIFMPNTLVCRIEQYTPPRIPGYVGPPDQLRAYTCLFMAEVAEGKRQMRTDLNWGDLIAGPGGGG